MFMGTHLQQGHFPPCAGAGGAQGTVLAPRHPHVPSATTLMHKGQYLSGTHHLSTNTSSIQAYLATLSRRRPL